MNETTNLTSLNSEIDGIRSMIDALGPVARMFPDPDGAGAARIRHTIVELRATKEILHQEVAGIVANSLMHK